jgi:phosphoglycolate phosphatase
MHVLFDLDGTLLDPKPGILGSIQYALGRLGAPVPPADEIAWAIGPPLRTTFPKLLERDDQTEEAVALYRENYRNGAMYDARVYPGIPDALAALTSAGCRLIIATAKPHVFARPILQHFGLDTRFIAIHGPELDGTHDNKADLVAHIVRQHDFDVSQAVMIGDREHDMIAAGRNTMRAVGVTWGYGSKEELTGAGAATLCDAPNRLPETLALLR